MKPRQILLSIALPIVFFVLASTIMADENCEVTKSCLETKGAPELEILAYPEPDVSPLLLNDRAIHDRWYMQVDGQISIFDTPNGNVIRTLDGGFNFVTALSEQDGWTQINQGEWVNSESLSTTNWIVSDFAGIQLPEEPLPYTMAWVLVNLYPSKYPGGDPAESNGLTYRYTRVNLYATVKVDGYEWFQIAVDKWIHQHHVARYLPVARPKEVLTDKWISIDLYEQVVIAYEGDRPVFATLIATGLDRWPTREGTYNIYFRRERKDMSGGVPGDDYYFLEEVPWTMFFDEGRALHGAYWHDGFGYRRSHGCVNLSITDAKWLYDWVASEMGSTYSADVENGPAVYVYSSGIYE